MSKTDTLPGITASPALMNSIDEDIAERLKAFVSDKEAFSDNTWRQLLSVMRIGSRWATKHDRQFLPMDPADL